MLLDQNIELALVKEVGEDSVTLEVKGEEIFIELEKDALEEFHVMILQQENLLVPFNTETNEILIHVDKHWNEEEMEELVEASRRGE